MKCFCKKFLLYVFIVIALVIIKPEMSYADTTYYVPYGGTIEVPIGSATSTYKKFTYGYYYRGTDTHGRPRLYKKTFLFGIGRLHRDTLYGVNGCSSAEIYSVGSQNGNQKSITAYATVKNVTGRVEFKDYRSQSSVFIEVCPHSSQSRWLTSGDTHYRACNTCGTWLTSHNRNSNYRWSYNEGSHWAQCNTCGLTWASSGHGFGGWYGNTATCTAGGNQYRKCNTCGYVASAATSALGHNYGAEYSENGQIKKRCSRCGYIYPVRYISYQVKYNGNGATEGSMENSTHVYETEKMLSLNNYKKTGYTFLGWNSDAAAEAVQWKNQETVKNLTKKDGDIVNLYAKWKINQYPVRYIIFDETQNKAVHQISKNIDYGTTVKGTDIDTELNPDANHVFYISGDDRPYRLNMDGNIETAAKVTVTGATVYRYCRLNEIKVTFDLNKPAASKAEPSCNKDSMIVIPLQSYGTLPEAKLLDYTFDGWYTAATGGKKITAESTVEATREHKLYAHWIGKPPVVTDTTTNPEVIEYLGINEPEYIKQYGPLSSDLIQEGKLQYPYSKTKIAAYTGGGVAEDGSTNHWTWQISTDGTTWSDLILEGETRTEANGVTYRTYAEDAEAGTFYLEIDHAIRDIHNTKYRIVLKNNAGSSTSDPITLFVYWLPGY